MQWPLMLLTCATPEFEANAQALCENALSLGFDGARLMRPSDVEGTASYRENNHVRQGETASLVDTTRCNGFWDGVGMRDQSMILGTYSKERQYLRFCEIVFGV
jgi:hypothetical protein